MRKEKHLDNTLMAIIQLSDMYRDGENRKTPMDAIEVDTEVFTDVSGLSPGDTFPMGDFGTPDTGDFFFEKKYDDKTDHDMYEVVEIKGMPAVPQGRLKPQN